MGVIRMKLSFIIALGGITTILLGWSPSNAILPHPAIEFRDSTGSHESMIVIPTGQPVTVDGTVYPGEWDDSGSLHIQVRPGWCACVLAVRRSGSLRQPG
jgi:hypothetical protein